MAVRRAAERFDEEEQGRAAELLEECVDARGRGDVRHAMRAHTDFHFALYEAAGSPWLVRLIRPAWESCERYRAALLAQHGSLQDRHAALDRALLDACSKHDPELAAQALSEHLELFGDFYSHELGGRGIFEPASGRRDPLQLPDRLLGERRLEQLVRDEGARARAEPGPGMRRGADVVQPLDGRRVAGLLGERAPEEVLVERERARVRIAAREVDVRRLEVGRREHDALEDRRLEVRRVAREPLDDAVRVALAQRLRPRAVARVEHAGGVALHVPGQLLELDPDDPLAVGGPALVHRASAGRRRSSPRPAAALARPR